MKDPADKITEEIISGINGAMKLAYNQAIRDVLDILNCRPISKAKEEISHLWKDND